MWNWRDALSNSWVITVGGGFAVVGISTSAGRLRSFWADVWTRLRSRPIVPRGTLRIVQSHDSIASYWSVGSFAGPPETQVVFEGYVTNISGKQNQILGVEIPTPLTRTCRLTLTRDHSKSGPPQALSPNECVEIHALFSVKQAVGEPGKSWKTSLVFIDQYNRRHKLKNCIFRALPFSVAQRQS
jgi:hypothetical protein